MQAECANIKRGTVREHEFVARVAEAAPLLIEDYVAKVAELKVRYY